MPEKKFGEAPVVGQNLFEAILEEQKREGFSYATDESLTGFVQQDDSKFKEVQTQSLAQIEAKYRKINGVQDVRLLRKPGDNNLVWVFLKYQ